MREQFYGTGKKREIEWDLRDVPIKFNFGWISFYCRFQLHIFCYVWITFRCLPKAIRLFYDEFLLSIEIFKNLLDSRVIKSFLGIA